MFFLRNFTGYLIFLSLIFFVACNDHEANKELVLTPESIDVVVKKNIASQFISASEINELVVDSLQLTFFPVFKNYYEANEYRPVWSSMEKWNVGAADLVNYLGKAAESGLFKEDYHFTVIDSLKRTLDNDSLKRTDAVLWTKADLLLTDAFMHVMQDLKQGRLQPDSLAWKNNPVKYQSYFSESLDRLLQAESMDSIASSVEPKLNGYRALKTGIKTFLNNMDTKIYTYVSYPYKQGDTKDSIFFVKQLLIRLKESGIADQNIPVDSFQLASFVKTYQQQKKLKADGKISSSLIRILNTSDMEKFNRIAITLDRYKQLPDSMPERYILVNLPAFYLQVWDTDTIALTSKIICGKPATSTPFITSAISDLVIFPTWTVPVSIIKKELLPGLKKSSNYLTRKGLNLYNYKGELIDPTTVDWAKYSKGIPYKVQQGSGIDNALGVIKFNFYNPFDVYLHDTNQRYLFKNGMRALSHGCVRVQDWEKLAFYIARNDSSKNEKAGGDPLKYNTDSISKWIAQKEKHRVDVKYRIPLFIRYFGCEEIDGTIKFYDDIYDDDKIMKENYFSNRNYSL